MVKAVIFDFWGTLANSGVKSPLRQAYNMMGLYRFDFPEFVRRFESCFMTREFESLEQGFREVCRKFGINCHENLLNRLIGLWNKSWMLASLYEDTTDALGRLREKGYKLGLLSNTDGFSVRHIIEKFELAEKFDAMVLSFECGLLKNDKEMFDLVLEKLGVKAKDAVMVGDSIETDIKGAENAGVKALLMDRRDKRSYENKVVDIAGVEKAIE